MDTLNYRNTFAAQKPVLSKQELLFQNKADKKPLCRLTTSTTSRGPSCWTWSPGSSIPSWTGNKFLFLNYLHGVNILRIGVEIRRRKFRKQREKSEKSGIYIMQNIKVEGGGRWLLGKTMEKWRERGKKIKRGKTNGGKLHKNGRKGLKNASYWVINSKNFKNDRNAQYISLGKVEEKEGKNKTS